MAPRACRSSNGKMVRARRAPPDGVRRGRPFLVSLRRRDPSVPKEFELKLVRLLTLGILVAAGLAACQSPNSAPYSPDPAPGTGIDYQGIEYRGGGR